MTAREVEGHEEVLFDTIDELDVTDTVFHDLRHTVPLAQRIMERVSGDRRRVLLIGPNVALVKALRASGHDVRFWHVKGVALTEDLLPEVDRSGTADDLVGSPFDAEPFDVVVLPFLLEAVRSDPVDVLRWARTLISDGGRLLVVGRRGAALNNRVAALRGRLPLGDPAHEGPHPAWAWPMAPPRRMVDEGALRRWANGAGLRVSDHTSVVASAGVKPVSSMSVGEWLAAGAGHLLQRAVPSVRDTFVAELRPLRHGRRDHALGPEPEHWPAVTVVVASEDLTETTRVLGEIDGQTYPRSLLSAIVVTTSTRVVEGLPVRGMTLPVFRLLHDDPTGASAADAALRAAGGDIVALTDDTCHLPPGWIESGVRSMGGYCVALAGRVQSDGTSATPFLSLPEAQRDTKDTNEFPRQNSFWNRDAAIATGGFSLVDDCPGSFGWASERALSLASAGWTVRTEPTTYVFRHVRPPENRSWLRAEYERARQIPLGVRRAPRLRDLLYGGTFASSRTAAFDLALVGAGAAVLTGRVRYLGLAVPYVRSMREFLDLWPVEAWRTTGRHTRGIVTRSAVWAAGLARGSIEAKRVVL